MNDTQTPTLTPEQVEKEQRAEKCMTEFRDLLKKYNCTTDVVLHISTSGKIDGQINILAV